MLKQTRRTLGVLEGQLRALWADYLASRPDDWLSTPAKAYPVAGDIRSVANALAYNLLSVDAIRQRLDECKPLHALGKEN